MKRLSQPDFRIHNTINVTLADLGRKGCVQYVFNEAARMRIDDFLNTVSQEPFDQERIESWLKTKLLAVDGYALLSPKTPLEIASSDSKMCKRLMDYICKEIHWPGVN